VQFRLVGDRVVLEKVKTRGLSAAQERWWIPIVLLDVDHRARALNRWTRKAIKR